MGRLCAQAARRQPARRRPALHDYVRITGSCPLSAASASQRDVQTCAAVCAASAPAPARCLAVNYSPWYAKFPGSDPTVVGPPEQAELAYYGGLLKNLSGWLAPWTAPRAAAAAVGVGVGAFLLDSEKFSVAPGSSSAYRAALTRKLDLIFNLSLSVFGGARVEWYNRGSNTWSYTYGWVGPDPASGAPAGLVDKIWGHSTLDERGETMSVSLYSPRFLPLMRETYRRTVALALARNASGAAAGTVASVTPWISLGAGDHLQPTHACGADETKYGEPCASFDFHSPYVEIAVYVLCISARFTYDGGRFPR